MMNCEIRDLTKSYSSGFRLGPINLVVHTGELVGLLGPNGTGKTTLLRLILGALRPDKGLIHLFGVGSPAQTRIRGRIGFLDEEPIFYEWMKIRWLSRFISSYFQLWDDKLLREILGRFGIDTSQKVGHLSKGNKVRLGLALALARRPSLLILDEPTSGLDPIVRAQVLEEIEAYIRRQQNASALFSSRLTTDVERICNRAVILDRGRIVFEAELKERSSEGLDTPSPMPPSSLEETFFNCIHGCRIH